MAQVGEGRGGAISRHGSDRSQPRTPLVGVPSSLPGAGPNTALSVEAPSIGVLSIKTLGKKHEEPIRNRLKAVSSRLRLGGFHVVLPYELTGVIQADVPAIY